MSPTDLCPQHRFLSKLKSNLKRNNALQMILMLQLSSGVSALSSGFTAQVTQHQL